MNGRSLFTLLALFFSVQTLRADPPAPVEPSVPWADVTGDGVPELDEVVMKLRASLHTGNDAAKAAADAAVERVGVSAQKACSLSADHALMGRKASLSACALASLRLRDHVSEYVGRNADGSQRAFSTMAEFDFARSLPISCLEQPQRDALKLIRHAMEAASPIGGATPLRKFMSGDAFQKFVSGEYGPNVRGFIARAEDTEDLVSAGRVSVRDNLGLDYRHADGAPNPFNSGGGYVVIDIPVPGQFTGHVRVPKSAEGYAGGLDSHIEAAPSYTGSGLVCGVDGVLRRVNHLGRVENAQGQLVDAARDLPLGTRVTLRSDTGAEIESLVLTQLPSGQIVWALP